MILFHIFSTVIRVKKLKYYFSIHYKRESMFFIQQFFLISLPYEFEKKDLTCPAEHKLNNQKRSLTAISNQFFPQSHPLLNQRTNHFNP